MAKRFSKKLSKDEQFQVLSNMGIWQREKYLARLAPEIVKEFTQRWLTIQIDMCLSELAKAGIAEAGQMGMSADVCRIILQSKMSTVTC